MNLSDDFDEKSGLTPTVVTAVVAVTLFVLVILGIVVYMNSGQFGKNSNPHVSSVGSVQSVQNPDDDISNWISNSDLHPEDLDFWDKYPAPTATPVPTAEPIIEVTKDPSEDGMHTLVTYANGTEEWVEINQNLPKNEYDYTKLVCQSNLMKYYVNGKKVSYVGVDISSEQDYVDFSKVKKAGIDYVMLRVGARGYSTGDLILDEYFTDNIKRASNAGLDIGVYFFSQAITTEEAIEEAEMVLEYLEGYDVNYPIAFDMEFIGNDAARTDTLTRTEKTEIAQAFLQKVESAGYKCILYGSKQWLLTEIDISKLTCYDIWLSQAGDIPDYPYNFAMWQYDYEGTVSGIAGNVNMNISFVKYTEK